jgi:hypothetical protein
MKGSTLIGTFLVSFSDPIRPLLLANEIALSGPGEGHLARLRILALFYQGAAQQLFPPHA